MKRVAYLSVGAAAAVLAAGCGSSSSPTSSATNGQGAAAAQPLRVMQAAYTTMTQAKTSQFTLNEVVSAAGHRIAITGHGAEDFQTKAIELTVGVAGQQVQMRQLNGIAYMKLPAAASVSKGKPWLAVNLNAVAKQKFGASLSQLQSSQDDPAQMVRYLQQASASGLHRVGTATIRGVATTEYAATVDLHKVAAAEGPAARQAIDQLTKLTGSSSYPMKVWVDARGLVRQLQFQISMSLPTAAANGSTPKVSATATMQLFDYGAPVSITAPPASQTHKLSASAVSSGLSKSSSGQAHA